MSYNINTPERQEKIAQYLRMIARQSPEWKEEYRKPLEDAREREKAQESEET